MDNADTEEYFSAPLIIDDIDPDLIVPETPTTQEREQTKLQLCNGNECQLSITECNLPCFDPHGNFYCPPCSYKSAISELENLQQEMTVATQIAKLARNSLSQFINAPPQPRPTINPVPVDKSQECNKASNVQSRNEQSDHSLSRRTRSAKAKQVLDASDEDFDLLDRVLGRPPGDTDVNEDTEMRENAKRKHKHKHADVDLGREKRKTRQRCAQESDPFMEFRYKKSGEQQIDTELQDVSDFEESTSSEEIGLNGEKPEIVSGNSTKQYKVVKRSTNPAFPDSRRKCLPWTHEEEEMIRKGVRIFSLRGKQKLPWGSILVHGGQVFDESRTPNDLKDKWRRMLKHTSGAK